MYVPPSPSEAVRNAIAEAKREIARQKPQPAPENPTIKSVLEGLNTLCEASNQAFEYKVVERTPEKLKVTTNFKGRLHTIRVKDDFVITGRFFRSDEFPNVLFTTLTKKAMKRGMLP
jgi:hypothetical protein